MNNIIKAVKYLVSALLLIGFGFFIGVKLFWPVQRNIDPSRMEKCLNLYREYRLNQDQDKLHDGLDEIKLSPVDFQKIIDRFIYYRTRKSSLASAMKLLEAFRRGFNIKPVKVETISGLASEPFLMDAEILTVFEQRPELIQMAFEGS